MRTDASRTGTDHARPSQKLGFSSLLFGIALVRLFDDDPFFVIGGAFIAVGGVFALTGGPSFLRSGRWISGLLTELEDGRR